MHQRRPLTATVSVDEGRDCLAPPEPSETLSPPSGGNKRGPRAPSPFVESSREAAVIRFAVLAEIKALQVRRNDSFRVR